MEAKVIKSKSFNFNEKGPSLIEWITIKDLLLPKASRGNEPTTMCGATYYLDDDNVGWIIFYNMLVIQIVPEEAHSYWHLKYKIGNETISGLWLIEDSEWKRTFNPKAYHIDNKKHFIVTFFNDIVEILCDDLIFGNGKFDSQFLADNDQRFAGEYIYRAYTYLNNLKYEEAKKDFEHYLMLYPNGECLGFAKKLLEACKNFINE